MSINSASEEREALLQEPLGLASVTKTLRALGSHVSDEKVTLGDERH